MNHGHRFNPEHAKRLDNPERRKLLPPEQLLDELPLQSENVLLDLGAGTGYFAIPAAKRVHLVYALDVSDQMISILRENMERETVSNIQTVQGEIEHIPLGDEVVNHVIASIVLHEVEPLSHGLREIYRVLKPGGYCICLEWEKQETNEGPPLHHRVAKEELELAVKSAGFNVLHMNKPTESHYLLVFRK